MTSVHSEFRTPDSELKRPASPRLHVAASIVFLLLTIALTTTAADFKIGPDVILDSLAVSAGNQRYLVVWRDLRNGAAAPQMRGATVSQTGVVSADFQISDASGLPVKAAVQRQTVAFDGTNYLIVWLDARTTGAGLRGALVSPAGTIVGGADFLIASLNRTQDVNPLVVYTGLDYVVAWQDTPLAASGTQISFARVSTSGTVGTAVQVPSSVSAISQSLEFLIRGPGNEVLLLYQDSASSPAVTRATRINSDSTFIGGGEGTVLFKKDFSSTGFGSPIGAAFDGTEYQILSSYSAQIDSSAFRTRLAPGGNPIRPSAPFAEVGQGVTGLAEDTFPRAHYNGAGEFLFIRNTKVSETAYHILTKRVQLDGTDRDPNMPLIDDASRGVLNGAVAANIGSQYFVTWMDGRRPDQQPADQVNIFGTFLDGTALGNTVQPFIKTVARARPLFGSPPLLVSFGTSGSTGIVDAFLWEFGDGASSQFGFTSHTYETKGEYVAVLSLIRAGLYVRDFVRIFAGTDTAGGGGGPPEVVGGSLGPNSEGINPAIVVNVLSATLNLAKPGTDSLRLSGFIDPTVLPVNLKDKTGTITVAGRAHSFTLDETSTFISAAEVKPVTRVLFNRFTGGFLLLTTSDDLAATFAALGGGNETTSKGGKSILIPVSVSFADLSFSATISATYVATSGKSGRAFFQLGVTGSSSAGFVRVFAAKAAQGGKKGAETHTFTITGNTGLPNLGDLVKADSGNWRITLGNYVEDVPVSSLTVSADVITFTSKQKGKIGLTNFFYNNRTGGFGVLMKNVPAGGTNPSGMPLTSSQFSRADMALSFDFNLQGGKKFQSSTFVRFGRKKLNSGKWILR
ncbi:MAG TPA: hypothetical protein VEJ63_08100 [Planctomycetota bacterium]|nr:hypothetical protein [Planctomycetota bacterium]